MAKYMKQNTLANNTLYAIAFAAIAIVLYRTGSSLSLRTYMDDDVYFVNALSKMSLFDFLHMRYMTWSGRVIIEAIMVKTINIHITWKIMVPACLLLLCHSINKISSYKGSHSPLFLLLTVAIFFLIPPKTLTEGALWVTGFYNYLLPVSFGLYSISVLNRCNEENNLQKSLSLLALPVACSNEQMGVIMFSFIIYLYIMRREASVYRIAFTMVSLGFFALLMLAPGNKIRFIGESRRIPEFADYTLLDKLGLGMDRFSSMINSHNSLLLLTSVLLVVLYLKNYKGKLNFLGLASVTLVVAFCISKGIGLIPSKFMLPPQWVSLEFYVRYATSLVFYVSLIYLSFLIFVEKSSYVIIFFAVMAPATILMIGFSPTVYASADRVLFIFEAMMMIVCFSCARKLIQACRP